MVQPVVETTIHCEKRNDLSKQNELSLIFVSETETLRCETYRGAGGEKIYMATRMNYKWFQARLRDVKMSQRRLASKLNLDPAAVSLMLHGKRKIATSEAAALADALQVPLEFVLEHAGVTVKRPRTDVIVVAHIDAEDVLTAVQRKDTRVPAPLGMAHNALAARVADPTSLRFGWTYYWSPRSDIGPDAVGRLCVVETTDGRRFCRYIRNAINGKFTLVSLTHPLVETAPLVSAAPVEWIRPH